MVLCAQVGRTRFTRPLPCGFSLSHAADLALGLLACIPRVDRIDKLSTASVGGVIALAHSTCVAYRSLHQRVPRALHEGPIVTRVHHAATSAPTTWHRVTFLASSLQGLLDTSKLNHWLSRRFNNNDDLHRKMMVRIQHWLSQARICFRVRLGRTRNSNRSTMLITSPHRFRARRILEQEYLHYCRHASLVARRLPSSLGV